MTEPMSAKRLAAVSTIVVVAILLLFTAWEPPTPMCHDERTDGRVSAATAETDAQDPTQTVAMPQRSMATPVGLRLLTVDGSPLAGMQVAFMQLASPASASDALGAPEPPEPWATTRAYEPAVGEPVARGTSDELGHVNPPPGLTGNLEVRLLNERHHVVRPSVVEAAELYRETVVVVCALGAIVHGRIVDSHGAPVTGASVFVDGSGQLLVAQRRGESTWGEPFRPSAVRAAQSTDAGFTLRGMPAGIDVDVHVLHAEHPEALIRVSPLLPGEERFLPDIVLTPGVLATITLTTTEGEPLGGGHVQLWMSESAAPARQRATDAQGRATFVVASDARCYVRGVAPGHAAARVAWDLSTHPALLLTLATARTVHGFVRSTDGVGIAEARVTASSPAGVWYARSGPEGSFSLADLPRASVKVFAIAEGYLPSRPVPLEAEAATCEVRLAEGVWIEGRVVSPNDAGDCAAGLRASALRADAKVRLRPVSAAVGRDGAFRLGPLQLGRHDVVVDGERCGGSATVQVNAEGGRCTVHLAPKQRIDGIVVGAATGEPIAGARVFADGSLGVGRPLLLTALLLGRRPEAVTDTAGAFAIFVGDPSPRALRIEHVGSRVATVDMHETRRIALARLHEIAGRVIHADGSAAANATLICAERPERQWQVAVDGTFTLFVDDPETAVVVATKHPLSWSVQPARMLQLVRLPDAKARVRGVVRRGGALAVGVIVVLTPRAGGPTAFARWLPSTSAQTDASGRFEIEHVRAGKYGLSVSGAIRGRVREIEVGPPGDTDVILDLPE